MKRKQRFHIGSCDQGKLWSWPSLTLQLLPEQNDNPHDPRLETELWKKCIVGDKTLVRRLGSDLRSATTLLCDLGKSTVMLRCQQLHWQSRWTLGFLSFFQLGNCTIFCFSDELVLAAVPLRQDNLDVAFSPFCHCYGLVPIPDHMSHQAQFCYVCPPGEGELLEDNVCLVYFYTPFRSSMRSRREYSAKAAYLVHGQPKVVTEDH